MTLFSKEASHKIEKHFITQPKHIIFFDKIKILESLRSGFFTSEKKKVFWF